MRKRPPGFKFLKSIGLSWKESRRAKKNNQSIPSPLTATRASFPGEARDNRAPLRKRLAAESGPAL